MHRQSLIVAMLAFAACKAGSKAVEPCDAPPVLEILAAGVAPLNVDEDGQSQPVHVTLFQLSGSTVLNQLDVSSVYEQGQAVFADEFVAAYKFVVYPDHNEKHSIELKPEVTHIVAVAYLSQPVGDGWYTTFRVPPVHDQRACGASPPCLYLTFERDEVAGGAVPPPGFNVAAFGIRCARPHGTAP